jgi:hypothetical protein
MATAEQRNHAKSFRMPPWPRGRFGLSAKGDVEYGVALVTAAKAESLVRRARTLNELAVQIVRLGR